MARSLGLVMCLISHHHPKERSLCHPHSRISPTREGEGLGEGGPQVLKSDREQQLMYWALRP